LKYIRPFIVIAALIGAGLPFVLAELDVSRLRQELAMMPELMSGNGVLTAQMLAEEAQRAAAVHRLAVLPDSVRVSVGDSRIGTPRIKSGVAESHDQVASAIRVQDVRIELSVEVRVYGKIKRVFHLKAETVVSGRGRASEFP
jgi:hypothetical protein